MTTSGMQRNRELKWFNVRLLDLTTLMKIFQFIEILLIISIMAEQRKINRSVVEKAEEQLDSILSKTLNALNPLGTNGKELHEFIYASLKKRYAPDAPINN